MQEQNVGYKDNLESTVSAIASPIKENASPVNDANSLLKDINTQGSNSRRVRTGILYVEEAHRKPVIELPRGDDGGTVKCQCPYCGVIRPGKFEIGKYLLLVIVLMSYGIQGEAANPVSPTDIGYTIAPQITFIT